MVLLIEAGSSLIQHQYSFLHFCLAAHNHSLLPPAPAPGLCQPSVCSLLYPSDDFLSALPPPFRAQPAVANLLSLQKVAGRTPQIAPLRPSPVLSTLHNLTRLPEMKGIGWELFPLQWYLVVNQWALLMTRNEDKLCVLENCSGEKSAVILQRLQAGHSQLINSVAALRY